MAKVEAKKALDSARKSGIARAVQDDIKVDFIFVYNYNTLADGLMHVVFFSPYMTHLKPRINALSATMTSFTTRSSPRPPQSSPFRR